MAVGQPRYPSPPRIRIFIPVPFVSTGVSCCVAEALWRQALNKTCGLLPGYSGEPFPRRRWPAWRLGERQGEQCLQRVKGDNDAENEIAGNRGDEPGVAKQQHAGEHLDELDPEKY